MPSNQAIPAEATEEKPYEIQLTDEAVYAYGEIPSQEIYGRIGSLLDFLTTHPYYGQEYDPYYEAALPPITCRVFYCGRYGVYYHVHENEMLITVLAIEDQRRNPLARFKVISDN